MCTENSRKVIESWENANDEFSFQNVTAVLVHPFEFVVHKCNAYCVHGWLRRWMQRTRSPVLIKYERLDCFLFHASVFDLRRRPRVQTDGQRGFAFFGHTMEQSVICFVQQYLVTERVQRSAKLSCRTLTNVIRRHSLVSATPAPSTNGTS